MSKENPFVEKLITKLIQVNRTLQNHNDIHFQKEFYSQLWYIQKCSKINKKKSNLFHNAHKRKATKEK